MDRCTVCLIGSTVVCLGLDSWTDKILKMNVSEKLPEDKTNSRTLGFPVVNTSLDEHEFPSKCKLVYGSFLLV